MTEDIPYEFMSMASLVEAGHITDVDNTLEELTFHLFRNGSCPCRVG